MATVQEALASVEFDGVIDVDMPLVQDAVVISRVLDAEGESWVLVRRTEGTDDMVTGGMIMEATCQWQKTRAGDYG